MSDKADNKKKKKSTETPVHTIRAGAVGASIPIRRRMGAFHRNMGRRFNPRSPRGERFAVLTASLPAGSITFVSAENPTTRTTSSIRDGKYFTDRAPIGACLVSIDTESMQVGNPAAYVPIPEKYRDSVTSGLKANLQPGENRNKDFVLEK